MSVESPPQVSALPPTLSIRSRLARLLSSAAARLRSTDLLSAFRTASVASLPAAMPTRPAMPAAVTSSPSPWPPFPWLADYRCQSADADLPPVRLPNHCRLRRHPLSGELPASRPVSPVIVLPLWIFVFIVVVVRLVWDVFNQKSGGCTVVVPLFVVLYYAKSRLVALYLYVVSVLLGIWRLLMIPA